MEQSRFGQYPSSNKTVKRFVWEASRYVIRLFDLITKRFVYSKLSGNVIYVCELVCNITH